MPTQNSYARQKHATKVHNIHKGNFRRAWKSVTGYKYNNRVSMKMGLHDQGDLTPTLLRKLRPGSMRFNAEFIKAIQKDEPIVTRNLAAIIQGMTTRRQLNILSCLVKNLPYIKFDQIDDEARTTVKTIHKHLMQIIEEFKLDRADPTTNTEVKIKKAGELMHDQEQLAKLFENFLSQMGSTAGTKRPRTGAETAAEAGEMIG